MLGVEKWRPDRTEDDVTRRVSRCTRLCARAWFCRHAAGRGVSGWPGPRYNRPPSIYDALPNFWTRRLAFWKVRILLLDLRKTIFLLVDRYYSANWDIAEVERVWKDVIVQKGGLVNKLYIPPV